MEVFQYEDESNGEIVFLRLISEITDNSINLKVNQREKIFNKILKLNADKLFNGWKYFKIKKTYGTEKEVEEFINDNLKYTYFKQVLINDYCDKGEYNKVIELCLKA